MSIRGAGMGCPDAAPGFKGKETAERNRVLRKKLGFSELFCAFFGYERTHYLLIRTS